MSATDPNAPELLPGLTVDSAAVDRLYRLTSAVVLTVDEARVIIGKPCDRTFAAWCRRWKVRAVAKGRYNRIELSRGLERERMSLARNRSRQPSTN